MFHDRAHALCSSIAEEVREKIRRDRRRVKSVNVAKLLREIEKGLQEPGVTVEALRKRCGVRDKNVSTTFNRELGLAPRDYLFDKRMQIAARALATSKLEVWRISAQVGYLTAGNFSRAFSEWSGKAPEAFRAEHMAAETPEAPAPVLLTPEHVQRALAGDLEEAEAAALIGQLGELQQQISDGYQTLSPPASDRYLSEQMAAAYLWRCIEHQDDEIQRTAVENQAADYHTPALFLLLSTASVEASETDAERATRLAALAMASLQAIEERLGDRAPPYQVRAHAVTGHAHASAARFDAARRAFAAALEPLETMNDAPNPVVLAELCLYLGLYNSARGDLEKADEQLGVHSQLMQQLVDQVKSQDSDGQRKEAGGSG